METLHGISILIDGFLLAFLVSASSGQEDNVINSGPVASTPLQPRCTTCNGLSSHSRGHQHYSTSSPPQDSLRGPSKGNDPSSEECHNSPSFCSGLTTAGVIVTVISVCVISSLCTSLFCVCLGLHRKPDGTLLLLSQQRATPNSQLSISTSESRHATTVKNEEELQLPPRPENPLSQTCPADQVSSVVLQNPVYEMDSDIPIEVNPTSSPDYIQLSRN